jgi:hypothetical protein
MVDQAAVVLVGLPVQTVLPVPELQAKVSLEERVHLAAHMTVVVVVVAQVLLELLVQLME